MIAISSVVSTDESGLVIPIMFSQMRMGIIALPAVQQIARFRKYLGL